MLRKIIWFIGIFFLAAPALAQTEVDERAVISFDQGLGFFAPDSSFGLNLRFRMQNRMGMNTVSGTNFSPDNFEANVRRLRLRFDGFVGQSGLTYYLQLSFTRGDQDWDVTGFPGILRDAMVFYNFTDNFYMGMGQGKLPGNRQRVISSGQQQFVDRSLVNALFNIDRDFGMMAYYSNRYSNFHFNLKGALTTGEGRNIQKTDDGLAYTGRIELLPLGSFKNDGDFLEGDLMREPSPRISFGASYSFNNKARRTLGQRGYELPAPADITSYFLDAIAKYQGWALQGEYATRRASVQPGLEEDMPDNLYIYTGEGLSSQVSYIFPGNTEMAVRYTYVRPHDELRNFEPKTNIYTLGASHYFTKHRNKFQVNVSYHDKQSRFFETNGHWNVMMQFELGI